MKKPHPLPCRHLRFLLPLLWLPALAGQPFSAGGADADESSPIANSPQHTEPVASIDRDLDIDRAFRSGDFSRVIALTADLKTDDPLITYRALAFHRRGELRFFDGDIDGSISDFDAFLAIQPDRDPYHWQRGISYYYAGEFEKGKAQFERHQTVNPEDVENAVFHFICSVRAPGGTLEAARENLIPIDRDPRVPMREIHAFYAGTATEEEVISAAGAGRINAAEKANQLFYAHLYLGLFHDATGDAGKAARHIALAAGQYRQDHYMGQVAKVHAKLRKIPIESPAG